MRGGNLRSRMTPEKYDAWYRRARGAWIGEIEFRLLANALQPRAGETLLDIGCGTGYFTRLFAARAGVCVAGLDPDPNWLRFARNKADRNDAYVAGRSEKLPFRDRSFDRAIAVTSLCFIAAQRQALREIIRVTRKRVALGLLNRHSLLYLRKGRHGGAGGYRGAHCTHRDRHARCSRACRFGMSECKAPFSCQPAVLPRSGPRRCFRADSFCSERFCSPSPTPTSDPPAITRVAPEVADVDTCPGCGKPEPVFVSINECRPRWRSAASCGGC